MTDETLDSLRLSWTVAQGSFDSFLLQYRDAERQPQAVPMAADQREATVRGLAPGRKYKFLLYGLLGGKRLGPISALGMTGEAEDLFLGPQALAEVGRWGQEEGLPWLIPASWDGCKGRAMWCLLSLCAVTVHNQLSPSAPKSVPTSPVPSA